MTDNVLAFGTLNIADNVSANASGVTLDTRKVKNGQIHFGMNLTFGREKKVKDLEGDEDRAAPVPENEEGTEKLDKEKNGIQGKSTKTVYPTGKTEANAPKRTDYSEKGILRKKKRKNLKRLKVNLTTRKKLKQKKIKGRDL